jgi:hypothetical protein
MPKYRPAEPSANGKPESPAAGGSSLAERLRAANKLPGISERLRLVCAHFEGVKKVGESIMALCPCHDDNNPSLAIREGGDGKVLLRCHAGCSTAIIAEVVGLRMNELMPDGPLPRFLIATYDFVDAAGKLLYQELRYEPKGFRIRQPDGRGGWVWSLKGVQRVLYNLPAIQEAPPDEVVYLVESPGKANLLTNLGLVATATVNGAKAPWLDAYTETLRDRPVVILPDNDPTGWDCARDRARALQSAAAW